MFAHSITMQRKVVGALLVLVMGLLLFAAQPAHADGGDESGAVDVVVAPLVDHGQAGGTDPGTDMNPKDYAVTAIATGDHSFDVALTASGLQQHYNGNHTLAYWIGVGIPYQADDMYATGFGECPENPVFATEDSVYEKDGKEYRTFYWGTFSSLKDKTAYVAVKHQGGSIDVYSVSFENTSCQHDINNAYADHGTVEVPATANDGDTVSMTITPSSGYKLGTLTVRDAKGTDIAVTDDNTFEMPAANVNVAATFVQTYAVSIDEDIQNGIVTADATEAAADEAVTLTVTPAVGYELDTLTVKQGEAEIVVTDDAFTMPAGPVTVSATFVKQVYDVQVADDILHGAIATDKTQATMDEDIVVAVEPEDGYELSTLTYKDDAGTETAIAGYTFAMPASNVTVFATFTVKTYAITVEKAENGVVTVDKESAPAGTRVAVSVSPEEGYSLGALTVKDADGAKVSVSDGEFTMPESPVTVSAVFTPIPIRNESMYRLYNPYSGEHHYTSDLVERGELMKAGWVYEGEAWIAPSRSNTPVYRLYNPNEPLGDHHYTRDEAEYDELVEAGWTGEGIGWYSDDAKGTPLYRVYNPNAYATGMTGAHHYTASKDEADSLVELGWVAEDIAWYGVAQ